MLGREATTLNCDLDYFAIAEAFRSGTGLHSTTEFFPEGAETTAVSSSLVCLCHVVPGRAVPQGLQ
jgi:hypothetical protein